MSMIDYYSHTPTQEELQAFDKAYARLDSISGIIGVSASRPIPGERPRNYRRRLLAEVQPHSAKFKDKDTNNLMGDAFDYAEDLIYQDAVDTARNGLNVPAGQIRPLYERDAYGRLITRWAGSDYLGPFWDTFTAEGATVSIRRPK